MSQFHDLLRDPAKLPTSADGHNPLNEKKLTKIEEIDGLCRVDVPRMKQTETESRTRLEQPSVISVEEKSVFSRAMPNGGLQQIDFAKAGKLKIDPKLPVLANVVDTSVVEHYRRLRTKILQQQTNKLFRSLVVTSPGPEEGKTLTVLNLGWSFGMLPSFKVLLVDGDLRRGSLGTCLGLDDRPGLSNFVDGSARLEDVVLHCEEIPLYFIGRGNSKTTPAELLQSSELRNRFQKLAEHFSLVLVDSPPANLITDVQLLAANCDAVLLVARAFSTTTKAFEKAVQDVSSFRVIGTVLNGANKMQPYRKYRNYYY